MRFAALLVLGALGLSAADPVADYVRSAMTTRRIPGLAFAVVRDGKLIRQEAYGVAHVELQVPMQESTVFLLASLTKTFTAAAVLELVDQGKLALDDPIAKHVRGLPQRWSTITVRHCLSHVSGLPDVDDEHEHPRVFTLADAIRKLGEEKLDSPGTRSQYNQMGFALLGAVVREVSGLGFEEFIAQRLWQPLAMTQTSYGDQIDIVGGRASMYTVLEPSDDRMWMREQNGQPVFSKDRIYAAVGYVYPRFTFTGAGANSTIADMVKWELGLSAGKVLSPATLAESARPFRLSDGKLGEFGLGWYASTRNGHRVMQMSGGGAVAHLRLPDDHLSVIVLTNLQGASPQSLAMGIAQLYIPQLKAAQ